MKKRGGINTNCSLLLICCGDPIGWTQPETSRQCKSRRFSIKIGLKGTEQGKVEQRIGLGAKSWITSEVSESCSVVSDALQAHGL